MLIAKVRTFDAGHELQQERMRELFKIGDEINVEDISVGQWNTSVKLEGIDYHFNSVFFDFYEDTTEIDIYKDPRYNPYLSLMEDE